MLGTFDDGLAVVFYSSCIDAGSNNAVPGGITTDIKGDDRISNGVDMGAYEYTGPPNIICVDKNANPNGDGDPADGIAGWRLDVVPEMPIGFWSEWNTFVRSINPDAYTTSEVWLDARKTIVDGGFSSTMNYFAFAFPVKGFLIDGAISAARFDSIITSRRTAYQEYVDVYGLPNLVDSHDTPRLSTMAANRGSNYQQPEKGGGTVRRINQLPGVGYRRRRFPA